MRTVLVLLPLVMSAKLIAGDFEVKSFGAKADGRTLDTAAINRAIEAASAAGGGTVRFAAGTYLSGSIHLRSNITLHLDAGAVLEATSDAAAYDAPEPNAFDKFQDFGHSHWHNSLIWGEGLENISITGSGRIYGKGLSRGAPGGGNKAIALKLCRNVTLRDFSILSGGHFGLLATGVDNLTVDNLRIDTNRDGLDIDSCRNVRISNTSVNSPNDDAIVLKSSYGLGFARATEQVTIVNCLVSGYDIGTMLDGTYKKELKQAPDRDGPTGRLKLGTESNGGFRNITISNIVFDHSRGFAIETVDGGPIEDISVSNLTMRDVSNSPIFIRIGSRLRGPAGTPVGTVRRVSIDNVVVSDADPRYASIIAGLPGHPVEDVRLSNIHILYRGGLTLEDVAKQPANLVNSFFFRETGGVPPREPFATPEREKEYPEPSMFGLLPAYGLFVRHARGVSISGLEVGYVKEDKRPAFVIEDVQNIEFDRVKARMAEGASTFVLLNVSGFRLDEKKVDRAARTEIR